MSERTLDYAQWLCILAAKRPTTAGGTDSMARAMGGFDRLRPPPEAESVNPWLGMWFAPRRTFRALAERGDFGPYLLVFFLAILAQGGRSVNMKTPVSITPETIQLIQFGAKFAVGLFAFAIFPMILERIGWLFGSSATSEMLRAAVSWGLLPKIPALLIPVYLYVSTGSPMITRANIDPAMFDTYLQLAGVALIFTVWSSTNLLALIAEAYEFSILGAMGASFLAVTIFTILLFLVGGGVFLLIAVGSGATPSWLT